MLLPVQCSWFSNQSLNNGNRTKWTPIRSVIIRVINKIGWPHSGNLICLITSMITDRIGWEEVLLPINHNYNKIWALWFAEMSGRHLKFGLFKISLLLALILANPDDVKTLSQFLIFYIILNKKNGTILHNFIVYILTCDWLISKFVSKFCLGGLSSCGCTVIIIQHQIQAFFCPISPPPHKYMYLSLETD